MRTTPRRIIVAGTVAGIIAAILIAPSATGATSPLASPTVTPSAAPVASPTVVPSPTVDPVSPSPTVDPVSPSPTVDPASPSPTATAMPPDDDEHDDPHDGPTLPLTRELPPGSPSLDPIAPSEGMSTMRLTVPSYGPQPVFRFPFAPKQRWGASGSHADSDGIHRGAVDFAPLGSADRRVRAVASGMVYRVTCGSGWFLGIDHGGGWMSEYYHLTGARSSLVGTWVEAGTPLGDAGQTLPCGGTPGWTAHVHLSILNSSVDVPSGKRQYVAVSGIQFDNFTLHDSSGAYDGVWRDLLGRTVLTARGVTCCLEASSRVAPSGTLSFPDTDGDGIDDRTDTTGWDTDLDSNGRPDLVGFAGRGVWTSANTGRGFGAQKLANGSFGTQDGWSRSLHPRMTVDVTGDGRPDVVGFGAQGVTVAVGAPGSFGRPRLWVREFGSDNGWRVGRHHRTVVDVTGDGLADIVGFGRRGVWVARNTGTSFAASVKWTAAMGWAPESGGWVESRHPRRVIDVTGDGRPDLVGFGVDGVYVARNTGRAFADPVRWSTKFGEGAGPSGVANPRYVVDMNDDGRPDIVGFGASGVWIARNTGSAFATPVLWSTSFRSSTTGTWRSDRHSRTLADVNGDGRPDIVGFAATGTHVAINRGSSFGAISRWTTEFGSTEWTKVRMPRIVVDANGDGRADVVGFARDGVHLALSTGTRFRAPTHASRFYGWGTSSSSWSVERYLRAVAL